MRHLSRRLRQTFDGQPRHPAGVLCPSQVSSSFLKETILLHFNHFLSFLHIFITQVYITKEYSLFCLLFINVLFKSFSPKPYSSIFTPFENNFCTFVGEHGSMSLEGFSLSGFHVNWQLDRDLIRLMFLFSGGGADRGHDVSSSWGHAVPDRLYYAGSH